MHMAQYDLPRGRSLCFFPPLQPFLLGEQEDGIFWETRGQHAKGKPKRLDELPRGNVRQPNSTHKVV
jgi:hypothetical protein